MSGKEWEDSFVEKTAWWTKWGGLGIAFVGAITGVNSLVMPGLLLAAGGFVYEGVTGSDKK
ncbi:hypothetical protein KJ980_00240 [Patescibacteria group bacterium]|nr:hypothetical protein [Patescibacteria group bacterium]MBU4016794.1 hypothetical protein [Patescibacteria group bacterium]MBU4098056.1 hypothetical protein [Patescibacteria group bacterium]